MLVIHTADVLTPYVRTGFLVPQRTTTSKRRKVTRNEVEYGYKEASTAE